VRASSAASQTTRASSAGKSPLLHYIPYNEQGTEDEMEALHEGLLALPYDQPMQSCTGSKVLSLGIKPQNRVTLRPR